MEAPDARFAMLAGNKAGILLIILLLAFFI
jgi:hypothetical protein